MLEFTALDTTVGIDKFEVWAKSRTLGQPINYERGAEANITQGNS